MGDLKWQTRDEMELPTNALQSLRESFARTSKDMGVDKMDAWLYGIIMGWEDASYIELSLKHNWSKEQVEYNKLLHNNYNKAWSLFMDSCPSNKSSTEIKDDKIINHIRNIKLMQAIYSGKKFYVECYPTDKEALCFPNSNMAVKEIELPDFDLYEEKLGYRWVKV